MAIDIASMEISILMESFPDKTESTELLELLFIELVFTRLLQRLVLHCLVLQQQQENHPEEQF